MSCLVRETSDCSALEKLPVHCVNGDLGDHDALTAAMVGNDALVNVASVGFGHAPTIVSAAEAAGIRRAVFVSTTAIFTALNAGSKSARMAAEDTIRSSSLETTILRPTMIYGSSRDRNMCRLIRFLSQWRVVPVFGKGIHLQDFV